MINSNSRCLRKCSKLWRVIFTKQQHQDEMGLMGKQVYRLHVKVLTMYGPLRWDGNCLRVGRHTSGMTFCICTRTEGVGWKEAGGPAPPTSQLWKQNFIFTLGGSEAEHKLFFWGWSWLPNKFEDRGGTGWGVGGFRSQIFALICRWKREPSAGIAPFLQVILCNTSPIFRKQTTPAATFYLYAHRVSGTARLANKNLP